MLYIWRITVPANTAIADAKVEKKPVHNGVITKIEIYMPPGCHALARAQVLHRLTQLLPFNEDEYAAPNGYTVTGKYEWPLIEPKPEITLKAWNVDDTYQHTITFRIQVEDAEVATPWRTLHDLIAILKRLMGL